MSVNAVATFLAVGALLLLAALAVVALMWATRAVAPASRSGLHALSEAMKGIGVPTAWVMATVAMAGSLYFSEIAHFPPCEYCWYQRIAMYPLAILLGVATFSREARVRRMALPLAVPGILISTYHYIIQRVPDLSVGECSFTVPCTTAFVWKFDLVSIPFMAFVSFGVIIAALLLDPTTRTKEPG